MLQIQAELHLAQTAVQLEVLLKKKRVHKFMQALKSEIILALIMSLLFSGCNSQTSKMKSDTIYYKDFDIFKLKGIEELKSLNRKESVEVRYNNSIPVYIKYYKPERTVTLVLEDSFNVNGTKPVYIFSTSNFHGGQPGKHKVYSFHNEEYRDLLYIDLSDTIICKSHEVTKLEYYSYTLYLYVQNKDRRVMEYISGSNTKEDKSFSGQELYMKWLKLLNDDYLKAERKPEIKQGIPE